LDDLWRLRIIAGLSPRLHTSFLNEVSVLLFVIVLVNTITEGYKMIAVLFEATLSPEKQDRYFSLAAQLKPFLTEVEGFISIERFESLTAPGKVLSLSWWKDEQAVLAWKKNMLHQQAQAEGRASVFATYQIRVAELIREYSFTAQEGIHHG
jgi:heme-degrading monooxygenase HmoA